MSCSATFARHAAVAALCALVGVAAAASEPAKLTPDQELARDIYRELVEINTSQSVGDTYAAAQAMAARLKAGGFPDADVHTFQTAPKRGNLVARLHGTGKKKPILLLAHIDVVEALRSDWTTDPYRLVEQDGYYYGRGTGDDKFMAAAFVANMIRWKKEGYRPDRDLILALTTDEEISDRHHYGINDLIQNHRELIDAEYALNEGGGVALQDGKPKWVSVQTTEKLFQSYWLEVTSPGGHSSQPSKDNAIYRLAEGLARLEKFDFPVHLNETTRAYFEQLAKMQTGQDAQDMKAILASPPDAAAVERLATRPAYNAQLRTTCVATRLQGGHADNALPQLARAMVNCRIVPGETPDQVRETLVKVLADSQIAVKPEPLDTLSDPSPLTAELSGAIRKVAAKFWPGVPLLPIMSAGATDGRFLRNAGIPTYGHSGLASELFDNRAHGKDERVAVKSFFDGLEYQHQLVKALAGGK
ncbi:MAG TPA: M20/M25/M40 family metallo-hydrolase [Steroidobacteraceae bacterium]|nr:M20/M25/M40 family metallo-hydrolase [Steroidobacteraceae bacterium]